MLQRASFAAALALFTLACDKLPLPGRKSAADTTSQAAAPGLPPAVAAAKSLMEQGQLDAALAKLQELPDDPIGI